MVNDKTGKYWAMMPIIIKRPIYADLTKRKRVSLASLRIIANPKIAVE